MATVTGSESRDAVQLKAESKPKPKSAKFPRSRRFSCESADRLKQLERAFVLDGVPLSHHANDETDRTQPSLNFGIPQYHAMDDKHCKGYFKKKGLPRTVEELEKEGTKTSSMQGDLFDRYLRNSTAIQYIQNRDGIGAGYTRRLFGGHLSVPTNPPADGYHGPEGYRRNTPDLRKQRSVFDYTDPFDDPKPVNRRMRTMSAPATMRLMRLKSASVYRSFPGGRRLVQSAMPRPPPTRELATGPVT